MQQKHENMKTESLCANQKLSLFVLCFLRILQIYDKHKRVNDFISYDYVLISLLLINFLEKCFDDSGCFQETKLNIV